MIYLIPIYCEKLPGSLNDFRFIASSDQNILGNTKVLSENESLICCDDTGNVITGLLKKNNTLVTFKQVPEVSYFHFELDPTEKESEGMQQIIKFAEERKATEKLFGVMSICAKVGIKLHYQQSQTMHKIQFNQFASDKINKNLKEQNLLDFYSDLKTTMFQNSIDETNFLLVFMRCGTDLIQLLPKNLVSIIYQN